MWVEAKVSVCVCVFPSTCFACTQMVPDTVTYLFMHLNVEAIGHLVVL